MNAVKVFSVFFILSYLVAGCAGVDKRIVLEESGDKPEWVKASKTGFEKDGKVYLRVTQQVRGNERVGGCYDQAKLNGKSALLAEIQEDVSSRMDSFQGSISENAELALQKSIKAESGGKLSGMRFVEEYYQRTSLGGTERVDCFVLGEISKDDYNAVKRRVVEGVVAADPRVKEAMTAAHINFFSSGTPADSARAPAAKQ